MSEDGETITLRKFKGDFQKVPRTHPERVKRGVILDTETTGLHAPKGKVIELGLIHFEFDPETGGIHEILNVYEGLEDPKEPLSPEIVSITGLTDEDLEGKSIDWNFANGILEQTDIVIAHHAGFDRPFVEPFLPASKKTLWGCSVSQVDWRKKGFHVMKLESLSHAHGFFVDAHRALNDCRAVLHLLSFPDVMSEEGATYLKELYVNAHKPFVIVSATGAPFESKDRLKLRRYRWDREEKVWKKTLPKTELEEELEWLKQEVYTGRFLAESTEVPIQDHFRSS